MSNRFIVNSSLMIVLTLGLPLRAQNQIGSVPIPDHVAYRHVFHEVVLLKQMAIEAAKNGQDRSALTQIVRTGAGLSADQGLVLEAIAIQCELDVAAQDARARQIIRTFRSNFPHGVVPKEVPPPPELADMQETRNKIVLSARDKLRDELGEQAFARFEAFVRTTYGSNRIREAQ